MAEGANELLQRGEYKMHYKTLGLFVALTMTGVAHAGPAPSETCKDFFNLGPPNWSAANGLIAFNAECGGIFGIYLYDPDADTIQRLDVGDVSIDAVAWSHKGDRLVYSAYANQEIRDVFIVDANTGKITQLTDDGSHGGTMSWSSDDKWLAMYGPDGDNWNIFKFNIETREKTQINVNNDLKYFNLTWLPDQNSYIYTGSAFQGFKSSIYLVQGDPSLPQKITPDGYFAVMPKPSPDGTYIIFDGNAGDAWELYKINLDGTGLERLTNRKDEDSNASFSPDRKSLAYRCRQEDHYSICILDLKTKETRLLFTP